MHSCTFTSEKNLSGLIVSLYVCGVTNCVLIIIIVSYDESRPMIAGTLKHAFNNFALLVYIAT